MNLYRRLSNPRASVDCVLCLLYCVLPHPPTSGHVDEFHLDLERTLIERRLVWFVSLPSVLSAVEQRFVQQLPERQHDAHSICAPRRQQQRRQRGGSRLCVAHLVVRVHPSVFSIQSRRVGHRCCLWSDTSSMTFRMRAYEFVVVLRGETISNGGGSLMMPCTLPPPLLLLLGWCTCLILLLLGIGDPGMMHITDVGCLLRNVVASNVSLRRTGGCRRSSSSD